MKKYFVGLDLGTNSIGYAVINEEYKICRKAGKHLWGTVMFDVGKKADERRAKRIARRSIERKRERVKLLQMLLAEEVNKKDENFFRRLKYSFLQNVEKDDEFGRVNKYNLFEGDFNDKNYYSLYPTIYHLRKALVEKQEIFDIRLVYLALHNLIKYRGNFLHEGEELELSGNGVATELQEIFNGLSEYYEDKENAKSFCVDYTRVKEILLNKTLRKSYKKDEIIKEFSKEKAISSEEKKIIENVLQLVLGNVGDFSVIFGLEFSAEEKEEKKKFKFSMEDEAFESNFQNVEQKFDSLALDVIERINNARINCKFQGLLNERQWVYDAMIDKYEKYGKDISVLRKLLKENFKNPEFYSTLQTKCKKYSVVLAVLEKNKGYSVGVKRKATQKEENVKILKEIVSLCADCEEKQNILESIENDSFLKLINSTENAVIPFQMQLKELQAIIENQGKYYPVLLEQKDKIISLLTFKRPYYVGVLNSQKQKSKYSWIEQNIPEKVYPWNFSQLVDEDFAAQKFIINLVNGCNYFAEEKVLAKNSIIYQKYCVLNELNTIKVNEKPITVEQKQAIFELFKQKKSVKTSDVIYMLKTKFGMQGLIKENVTGLSAGNKFLSSLSSLLDMQQIFGEEFVEDNPLYEEIIKELTIFTDVKMRKKALAKHGINNEKIEKLIKLKYKDWGRFSKKLLCEVYDTQGRNILDIMYQENLHFEAVINDPVLGIKEQIIKNNEEVVKTMRYEEVFDKKFISPGVKRTVWQTLKILKEICKIMGGKPAGIFLESTREEKVKVQTASRYEQLKAIYKSAEDLADCYDKEVAKFFDNDEQYCKEKLNNDFVYLYLCQMGKSMYSGLPLGDIDKLSQTCEIDHIIPRHYIKDDSFSNRVLVLKEENQKKTGTLGIPQETIVKMLPFWKNLKKINLVSEKKYNSLIKTEYTENDVKRFINRQLVETSQSVLYMRDICKDFYPESDVQMLKAGLSSQLRHAMIDLGYNSFYKLRALNDFHHAKDAYLAGVCTMFTRYAYPIWGKDDTALYYKRLLARTENYITAEKAKKARYGVIINKMITGEVSEFSCDENGVYYWNDTYYQNMLSTMEHNDCLFTKKVEFEANAQFYDETLYSINSDKNNLISLHYVVNNYGEKKPLPTRYGGYSSEKPLYCAVVTYSVGKKTECKLLNVPVRIAYAQRTNPNAIIEYFNQVLGEKKKLVSVDDKAVYKYQQVKYGGQNCFVVSGSEIQNATQLVLPDKLNKLIYYATNDVKKLNKLALSEKEELESLVPEFIEAYTDKLSKPYFSEYNGIAQDIKNYMTDENAKTPFNSLSFTEKLDMVKKLLEVSKSGYKVINLSCYNSSSCAGRMKGRPLYVNKLEFYQTSYTGFYKNKIRFNDGVENSTN